MSRPLLAALALLPALAAAAPPVFQLRARESLRGLEPGDRLTVSVRSKAGAAAARSAARAWSLVIGPCATLADGVTQVADARGVFHLTVPRTPAGDPYVCVARWHDARPSDDPIPLRFCLGDLTLRDCHPEWYAIHCAGVSTAECLLRATVDGKRSGGEPSGSLYVIADGMRAAVPDTPRAGCPVHAPGWGVLFTQDGRLMRLDPARRLAEPAREPPAGERWSSPWPDGDGVLLVATRDDHRALARLDPGGGITRIRALPAGAGRILGGSGGALVMSHRLSPHAIRVPRDATHPAAQLDVGAPVGDCAVEVGGVRVENAGVERVGR